MPSSFFYLQVDKNDNNYALIEKISDFAEKKKKQIYVVDRPLGDKKYTYNYSNALLILIPGYKLSFIDFGNNEDQFLDYCEDFIEDLGSISDKFKYKEHIGRPRSWRKSLITEIGVNELDDFEDFISTIKLENSADKRRSELLISLLTGSINNIDKVKLDMPDNALDKIKQKIILFDGDQTRFIYQSNNKKTVTIQGLSGTGKTELLLHKLKEIYTSNANNRVIFTCHNKILADNLKNRIPEFFDFMKVEEQIKWDSRLWCIHGWGSSHNPNSGAYRYICDFYNLKFYTYSVYMSFEKACQLALEELKTIKIKNKGFAFDYMLIDESQDFPKAFFELCSLVTKNTIYIAGDIFQSIFDDTVISEINPDFLLSKCYRTDPRTLMFAHSLGMGLFETPKLRWLEDDEWKACGYILNKNKSTYKLTREPLSRFEDLNTNDINSVEIVKTSAEKNELAVDKTIEIIHKIKTEYPTVTPDDIAIIFIDSNKSTYESADKLEILIPRHFGWQVNKAYESKEKVKNTLFVSNKNNVKGLEFPFVVCITKKINDQRSYRNSLYMMLTRSFLRSYLLLSLDLNHKLISKLEEELNKINKTGALVVTEPSLEEKQKIKTTITYSDSSMSYYDVVYSIFKELGIPKQKHKRIFEAIKSIAPDIFEHDILCEHITSLASMIEK
ncbi:DEAD/DEAH box helicase [Aeromonas caviae]|uniref:DEAD/DEAH box helicase n=2 Tax=Aeromonas caviae TaxID=648 RepID=UPI00244C6257|nr:DEAD/DEAH box helicase family protein [Aeromonas caviae]MDH0241007.1 AAA family ATPase [Aeromonas caviae]